MIPALASYVANADIARGYLLIALVLGGLRRVAALLGNRVAQAGRRRRGDQREPLRDPAVGVVTCFYRTDARGLIGKIDALSLSTEFLPGALVGLIVLVFRARDLDPTTRTSVGHTWFLQADYVIVGGGSAGSALANRLSADPASSARMRS